ncbi:hypothetical protein OAF54_00830 [bacterium]|nr:hypothetical protein [bacterium]
MNMKLNPRTGQIVPIGQYHRNEIVIAWRDVKTKIGRYVSFLIKDAKSRLPKKKASKEFQEKLAYWRKNGAPVGITDDTCDPFKSMADGKYYTSKKKYRNEISARGYEEVGNDKQEHRAKDKYWSDLQRDKDIKKDIAEVLNA